MASTGKDVKLLPRIHHVSLLMPLDGQAEARKFYIHALGFVEKPTPSGVDIPGLLWFGVGENGDEIHLIPVADLDAYPLQGKQHFCIEVDDLDVCRDMLAKAGYSVAGPGIVPHRPSFYCHDPFGNMIELVILQDG